MRILLISIFILINGSISHASLIMPQNSSKLAGKHLEYFEDKTNKLTLKDILEKNPIFTKNNHDFLDFGYRESTFWFHLKLSNTINRPTLYYFDYSYNMLKEVDFFSPKENNFHKISLRRYGKFKRSTNKPYYNTIAFFADPGINDIYIRVKTIGNYFIGFKFYTQLDYLIKKNKVEMVFGLFLGGLASIIVFNLILFNTTREVSYLIMIGLLLLTTVLFLIYKSTFIYIYPPIIKNIFLWTVLLLHILMLLLILSFRESKPYLKIIIRILMWVLIISTPLICITIYLDLYTSIRAMALIIIITMNVIYFCSLIFFKKLRISSYFIASATLFYISAWFEIIIRIKLFRPFLAFQFNHPFLIDLITLNVMLQPISVIVLNFGIIRLNTIRVHEKRIVAEQDYYKKLQYETNLKNIFIKNTSHKIVTPTQNIMCIIDELDSDDLTNETKSKFAQINEEISNLYKIISNFSISEKKIKTNPTKEKNKEEVNIKNLILHILSNLPERSVKTEFYLNIEDIKIYIDPKPLKNILVRIITNSLNTTQPTKLLIATHCQEHGFNITIADNGSLIDDASNGTSKFAYKSCKDTIIENNLTIDFAIVKRHIKELNGSFHFDSPLPDDLNQIFFLSENICGKAFYLKFPKKRKLHEN